MASKTSPLDERIQSIRDEIDAIIDARAEAVYKDCSGVPLVVIRRTITARYGNCQCWQYLGIKKQDDEAAAAKEGTAA